MRLSIAALVVLFVGSYCFAEAEHAAPAESHSAEMQPAAENEATPHPTPSPDPQWARSLVIVIFAMFAAAIPAGLLMRSAAAQEPPPADSHDQSAKNHADAHANHH